MLWKNDRIFGRVNSKAIGIHMLFLQYVPSCWWSFTSMWIQNNIIQRRARCPNFVVSDEEVRLCVTNFPASMFIPVCTAPDITTLAAWLLYTKLSYVEWTSPDMWITFKFLQVKHGYLGDWKSLSPLYTVLYKRILRKSVPSRKYPKCLPVYVTRTQMISHLAGTGKLRSFCFNKQFYIG